MAAADSGDGGGPGGSRLVAEGMAGLPGHSIQLRHHPNSTVNEITPYSRTGSDTSICKSYFGTAPNAAQPQPNRMSKKGVLPPEWGLLGPHSEGERHEDAVALHHQVYPLDRRRALLFRSRHLQGPSRLGGSLRTRILRRSCPESAPQ